MSLVVIVGVAGHVVEKAVEIVESFIEGMRGNWFARFSSTGDAPLADGPSLVARLFCDRAKSSFFGERLVETNYPEASNAPGCVR